eukprot:c54436_g1_i1 orf=128-376(-)
MKARDSETLQHLKEPFEDVLGDMCPQKTSYGQYFSGTYFESHHIKAHGPYHLCGSGVIIPKFLSNLDTYLPNSVLWGIFFFF